jgi:hypothetical protein
VPTIAAPHFVIDLHTLFVVTVFISGTAGLLLLFAWMQNRRTTALALWGIGYLLPRCSHRRDCYPVRSASAPATRCFAPHMG